MVEKSKFDELAGTLSEKERLELLERINKSMFMVEDEEKTIKRNDISQKEREAIIERDFGRLSFFRRLLLQIKSRLTGKSTSENFIQYKIKLLKKKVINIDSGLTGFETRDLTPKFAQAVFTMYASIIPVRELYKKLWMNKAAFEGAVVFLLQNRLEHIHLNLEDVISMEDLVEEYSGLGMKEKLRSKVIEKLQEKVELIPDELFEQVEGGLAPVYYLKELVLFPYISFFNLFHFNPQVNDEDTKPVFKSASAIVALDYLEKLYYAVYIAEKIDDPERLDKRILDYSFELMKLEEEDLEEEARAEEQTEYTGALFADILEVYSKVKAFNAHVPLADLIRYFTKDPYYQLVFYIPKLHLKEIYYQIMKEKVLQELDKGFQEIRKRYIEREVQILFKGKTLVPFHNYREYTSIDYKKIGVPFFAHTRSLNLLYNFIKLIYKEDIQVVLQLIQKGILAQNRITQDRLLRHATTLEELEEKIRLFDYSLSPESNDGKQFQRSRFMMAGDPGRQRMYKTLVLQKESTVKSLISLGEEALEGLRKIFEEIVTSPAENVKNQINNHYLIKGTSTLLSTAIRDRMDSLSRVRNLLSQLFKIEEG